MSRCSVTDWCTGRSSTVRSEEHTSELQSLRHLVCRLLLEKKQRGHRPHRQGRPANQRGCGEALRLCGTANRQGTSGWPLHRRTVSAHFFLITGGPPGSTLFPYTTLFR